MQVFQGWVLTQEEPQTSGHECSSGLWLTLDSMSSFHFHSAQLRWCLASAPWQNTVGESEKTDKNQSWFKRRKPYIIMTWWYACCSIWGFLPSLSWKFVVIISTLIVCFRWNWQHLATGTLKKWTLGISEASDFYKGNREMDLSLKRQVKFGGGDW